MTGASAWSVALVGMEGSMVEVEAAISSGLPRTVLVGLPDAALHEARDRCRAAVCATGLSWPSNVLTINLTPAGLPKAGTHFDLAIATATLAADGKVLEIDGSDWRTWAGRPSTACARRAARAASGAGGWV